MQVYKEMYNYEQYKGHSQVTKENSRGEQGAWKNEAPDGLLMIHSSAALLWSATRRIHKLQAPGSGRADPGESELPNEWWGESQVAYRDIQTCMDKSES